jgi:hypothetical protein
MLLTVLEGPGEAVLTYKAPGTNGLLLQRRLAVGGEPVEIGMLSAGRVRVPGRPTEESFQQ